MVHLEETDDEVKILSCLRNSKCTPDEIDIYKLCITEVREQELPKGCSEPDYIGSCIKQANFTDPSEEELAVIYADEQDAYAKCRMDFINNKICYEEFILVKPPLNANGKPDYEQDKKYTQCRDGLENFRQYLTFMDVKAASFDASLPLPTKEMENSASAQVYYIEGLDENDFAEFNFDSLKDIKDIEALEDNMLDAAELYGLDAIAMLANYSQSIPNILNLNFGTSGRILRYNQNIIKNGKLQDQVGYLGVLFTAMKLLNSESKLVPVINYVVNTIEFVGEKFFDHSAILGQMDDIQEVSDQIQLNFDQIFEPIYYEPCIDEIKNATMNINYAAEKLRSYLFELSNITQSQLQTDSNLIMNPKTQWEWGNFTQQFTQDCSQFQYIAPNTTSMDPREHTRGNTYCRNVTHSVMKLLSFITDEGELASFRSSHHCNIVDLTYNPSQKAKRGGYMNDFEMVDKQPFIFYGNKTSTVKQYPCHRDLMIMRSGAILQGVIQGIMTLSVYKQPTIDKDFKPKPNPYVKIKIWPSLIKAVDRLQYMSDKCKFDQQGERVAKEQFEIYMQQALNLTDENMKVITLFGIDRDTVTYQGSRLVNYQKVLTSWLSYYHSDMRWQIKVYEPLRTNKTRNFKYGLKDYKNEKMAFHNVKFQDSNYTGAGGPYTKGLNIVVFGFDAHKYFYRKYDNEEFHEFCHYIKED